MIDLDPAQFDQTVLQSDKPVLLYVTATWCRPCQIMKPRVSAFATVVEGEGKATVVMADADACKDLLKQLDVRGVPTLLVFKQGAEAARHVGAATVEQMKTLLGV